MAPERERLRRVGGDPRVAADVARARQPGHGVRAATAGPTARSPPRMNTFDGLSLVISADTFCGTQSAVTSRTGAGVNPAATPPVKASGKLAPVARYTAVADVG